MRNAQSYLFYPKSKYISYPIDLAMQIGSDKAAVIQTLNSYMHTNKSKKRFYHDGKVWVPSSFTQLHNNNFPFWSETKIRGIFTALKKDELILVANYNKNKYDKSSWYTINYDKFREQFGDCEISEARYTGANYTDEINAAVPELPTKESNYY